jgi:hypothetical protein
MSSIKLVKQEVLEKMAAGEMSLNTGAEKLINATRASSQYRPPNLQKRREQYYQDRELRELSLHNGVPLCVPALFARDFRLPPGLVLFGGVSGQAKTTTAANLVAGYLEYNPTKHILTLSNEEMSESFYNRVACIHLKHNFADFQNGRLDAISRSEVEDHAQTLMDRLIVDAGGGDFKMDCLEHVQAALEYAAQQGVGLVVFDYFQTVSRSETNEDMEHFRVLKEMGSYLRDYGRRSAVPVAVFAQLKPTSQAPDFKSRVEMDRTIYNDAFMAVEVVPNFETKTTKFVLHKDRLGIWPAREIEMKFVGGRYVFEEDTI